MSVSDIELGPVKYPTGVTLELTVDKLALRGRRPVDFGYLYSGARYEATLTQGSSWNSPIMIRSKNADLGVDVNLSLGVLEFIYLLTNVEDVSFNMLANLKGHRINTVRMTLKRAYDDIIPDKPSVDYPSRLIRIHSRLERAGLLHPDFLPQVEARYLVKIWS